MYKIYYTKQATKDISKLKSSHLKSKALYLLNIIRLNPLQSPPPFEKLTGELSGIYSRRINIKHRLVYEIFEKQKSIKILSLWTHYENI